MGGQDGLDIISTLKLGNGDNREKPVFSGLVLFDEEVEVGVPYDGRVILDEALDMLYEYDDSTHSVTPLSEETRSAYKKKFTMFPVVKYTRAYYSFNAEGCNDVKYNVSFGEDFDGQSPKTAFMFNPVKIDGQWYLSVKRSDQSLDEMNR